MVLSTGTPEVVVDAPPLVAASTGLLQAAVVVDHPANATIGDPDSHWMGGITYAPESPYDPILIDPCAVQTVDDATGGLHNPIRFHHPLIIETIDRCSTFGYKAADYAGRALRALAAKEGIALEREFESGAKFGSEPHLSDGHVYYTDGATTSGSNIVSSSFWSTRDLGRTVTGTGIPAGTTVQAVTPGYSAQLSNNATATGTEVTLTVTNPTFVQLNTAATAVSLSVGFALLQEAIAESTVGTGMIHCTALLAERLAENHGFRFNTDPAGDVHQHLTSANGNIVVAGNGYRGFGPDSPQTGGPLGVYPANSQAGQPFTGSNPAPVQWMYATDVVVVHRAETPTVVPDPTAPGDQFEQQLRQAMDRGTNTVVLRSSRPYLVEWAALCHAAVAVNPLIS